MGTTNPGLLRTSYLKPLIGFFVVVGNQGVPVFFLGLIVKIVLGAQQRSYGVLLRFAAILPDRGKADRIDLFG